MNSDQSSIPDANQSIAPKPEQNRMISTTSPLSRLSSDDPSCALAPAEPKERLAQPAKMPSSHAAASARQSKAVRLQLSLLVRVLFQYLERQDGETLILARAVLKDCERKHSQGESKYDTLADAIYDRLRDTVGETHWQRAREIRRRLVINQFRKKTMRSRLGQQKKL